MVFSRRPPSLTVLCTRKVGISARGFAIAFVVVIYFYANSLPIVQCLFILRKVLVLFAPHGLFHIYNHASSTRLKPQVPKYVDGIPKSIHTIFLFILLCPIPSMMALSVPVCVIIFQKQLLIDQISSKCYRGNAKAG